MSRDEVKQLLMRIQATYPNWKPQPNIQMVVDVWYEYLADYKYNVMLAGLNAYITTDTSGFAPSVGQVIQTLKNYRNKDEVGEMQAWGMIYKAISNGSYHAKEEYDNLPPLLQKVVGSPQSLKEWAMMDIATVNSVVQSNVLRTYKVLRQSEIETERIPERVRLALDKALSENKQIGKEEIKGVIECHD